MKSNNYILVTGDFCPINRTEVLIRKNNYEAIFADFLPIIKSSAFAITNLECPLTESYNGISKTGPLLRASPLAVNALSFAGFNIVTLANNHIMDFGIDGLISTIDLCERNNISSVGAGKDRQSARAIKYVNIANTIVAILNFSENEFSTTGGVYPGANPLNLVDNFYDIRIAKDNADYVIVIFHGGNEYFSLPSPRIKSTLRFFADAGASAVIGHHTHCYSGYEIYNDVPIFYSLGNFVFDNPQKRGSSWNNGFSVVLNFNKTMDFEIIPYKQCDKEAGVKLLGYEEKQTFNSNIEKMNKVILNDKQLEISFMQYVNQVKNMYLSFLEPHSSKILHFLRIKKLFPSLLSQRKRLLYFNLMRCESHREVLEHLLDTRSFKLDV